MRFWRGALLGSLLGLLGWGALLWGGLRVVRG